MAYNEVKFIKFTQQQWKEYIQEVLAKDDAALTRALLIVYDNQTDAEKHSKAGLDHNGVGFDKNDVKPLSEAAELIENGIAVPVELWAYVKERVPRYWRQIMEVSKANIANGAGSTSASSQQPVSNKVELLRYPTSVDWARCKVLALNTVGKEPKSDETATEWRRKILISEHSPIRTLMFTIRLEIPYYVSVHLVRHKYGIEHYVKSQRNDRQDEYDRTLAPQSMTVVHIIDVNAQELMFMARRRLCTQADPATRHVMALICAEVESKCPEFKGLLTPMCVYQGKCPEFKSCGKVDTYLESSKQQTQA